MTKSKVSTESLIGDMVATLNTAALDLITEEINLCANTIGGCDDCSLLAKCHGSWEKEGWEAVISSHLRDMLRKIRLFRNKREALNNAHQK